ncbi:tyrosine-type recombinase/integrase [Streptomyces scabiei]|uniref:tyrosine-type recombinase/integrase n=1 Tax=Streptomyces scabiei TaxID=1930 RepID=UPI0033E45A18
MTHRARDTSDYQLLNDDDPVRQIVAERLLPSRRAAGPLLVTPVRHYELVKMLREVLEHGRAWLADNHAADVHLLEMDVPPYPERDDTASELEGRSQDALPEQVFLQLMDERNLALLPAGNRRNCVELAMRVGRRPWELRHLEFDCLQWHDIDVEDPDGTVRRRSYPFLAYWMQKVRRRHKLPLHPSDAEVITRQQDHLRRESPHLFHENGRPRSTHMVLFPTPRRSRANALGERPYDSSTIGHWLETWLDQFAVTDEHGKPFDPARVFPYAFRHTYAQIRADAGVPLDILQVLMAHQDPSTTQVYYRPSHPRRVEAVRAIAAKYQFDLTGGRIRARTPDDELADRIRAGVGSVPVPAGRCHEMNNVRADGHGCPVYNRCFSCTYYTTDFTHLPELRQLRAGKAEQLAALESAYGSVLTARAVERGEPGAAAPGDPADRRTRRQMRSGHRLPHLRGTDHSGVLAPHQGPVPHRHPRSGGSGRKAASGAADRRPDHHRIDDGMTRPAAPRTQPGQARIPAGRAKALDAGRAAAVERRRADSERCRQRVLDVLAAMRKSRQALSDAEITRRAAVNPQYLQRHRDLKAEAETVRAHLAQDRPRAAAAATARKEAAHEVENRMLLEQNAVLQRTLHEVQNELRTLRAQNLGARLRDGLNARSLRDTEMEELREQRDAALAASRQAETAMQALRNVNQRLMIENSRLIAAGTSAAPRTVSAALEPPGP